MSPNRTLFLRCSLAIRLALTLLLTLPAQISFGINASPHPVELRQPDGTKLILRIRGDERFHWFEDLKGFTVIRDSAKQYVYGNLDGSGKLAPTALVVGKADPAAAGLAAGMIPKDGTLKKPVPLDEPARNSPQFTGPAEQVLPQGNVKNLVILCKFADHVFGTHTRTQADYDVLFNTVGGHPTIAPTGSVKDYYTEASYGTMTLQSTVVVWVTLPNNEAYYADGKDGLSGTFPKNAQGMVKDALDQADAFVNFAQFDQDNDGFADSITIIHSGYAAETGGGDGDWIWSHRWSLYQLPGGQWTSQETNGNGVPVKVYDYHTEAALWGRSGTEITRIGVICHETGHFFGLPDLYDTDSSSRGLGAWCLMANSWGFDGTQLHPPHLAAWCKVQLGWVTPTVITSGTQTALRVQTSPSIFKITQGFPTGEYLLIENRQPYGYDSTIPEGGLAIWHIDENKSNNSDEGFSGQTGWPENGRHYKIALLQADGLYQLERNASIGDAGDLYRAGGTSAITPQTVPSTDRYQGGIIASTNNSITNISASGATMTFTLNGGPTSPTITSASSASGVPGTPFSYQIVATNNPTSYGATGLPPGLSINPATGLISGTPAAAGVSIVNLSATNAQGTGTATLTLTVAAVITLGEALDAPNLPLSTGGNQAWKGQTNTTHDGVDAAQSGVLGDSQESWLETTVTGPGALTFWWKVSSETGYDFLQFFVDGVEPAAVPGISGNVDWTQKSISLSAGSHTLRWRYSKDGSVASGADAGWVDQVSFTAGTQPPVINSVTTASGAIGQAFSYQITATNNPTSYSASGLAPGLNINTSTGLISGTPTTAGTFPATLGATNSAGTGTITLTITIASTSLNLANALDAPALNWLTNGSAEWQPQTITTHDGTDAAQSGVIGNSQETYVETSLTGPGALTFWWKVSSESGYDFLRFSVDGLEQSAAPAISGSVDWVQRIVSIGAGSHTVRWRYIKDSSVVSGSDAGWVDQVVFTPGDPGLTLAEALDAPSLNWTTAGASQWTPQNATSHDGIDAAQSGAIGHSQGSYVESTVTGPGTLTFWWKVSSETSYDFLRFSLNGIEVPEAVAISGDVDWQQKSVPVLAGTHAVRWTYSKDGSAVSGSDSGWLDQVIFAAAVPSPEIVVEQPLGSGLVDGTANVFLGGQSVGSASGPLVFTVRNTGTVNLTGLAISKDGAHAADFTIQTGGTSTTLAPSDSTTFSVTFAPMATGTRTAVLHLSSNDADENPFDIALSGTGSIAGGFTNFQDAALIIGQANFTDQLPTASASVTPGPSGVAISSTGKLAVCDQPTGRVLIWNSIPTSSGVPADVVVGKANFTAATAGITAAVMGACDGVAFTPDGQKLIVSDSQNHRVLIWNSVPTVNGTPADVVIGQVNFVSNAGGLSATKLNYPAGLAVTPSGKLLVADLNNHRILIFNTVPTTSGAAADAVIGQSTMTTNTAGTAANQMANPWHIAVGNDGRLLVAETGNHRVTIFDSVPVISGAAANVVIGQTGFGLNSPGTSATKCNVPVGVAVSSAGQLAISDFGNRRVLIYSTVPVTNGAAATAVLGQPDFASSLEFNGGVSARSMTGPYPPAFASDGRLFIPGRDMRRAMVFGSPGPEIGVEHPVGTPLAAGTAAVHLGGVVAGGSSGAITFTIRNHGIGTLSGLAITKVGSHPNEFIVNTSGMNPTLAANGSTAFTVNFAPGATGLRTAVLRISSNDGDENPFDITLTGTGLTIMESWRQAYFSTTNNTGDAANTADPDFDGLINLQEMAFGINPTQGIGGAITWSGGTLTSPGSPAVWLQSAGPPRVFRAVYGRRKDYLAAGLSYTVEFSPDLILWQDSTTIPGVLASDAVMDAVWVPFPALMDGREVRFFRVRVNSP